jgi:hypothetical protein
MAQGPRWGNATRQPIGGGQGWEWAAGWAFPTGLGLGGGEGGNEQDALTMPEVLAKAHVALDRAVDRMYRRARFESDAARVTLLFKRYQAFTPQGAP